MSLGKPYSIFVKGNLKDTEGHIKIHLPYKEMRSNLWQLSLIEFSYECKEKVNQIVKISTNVINDVHCEKLSEIYYNPNIALSVIKGNINDKKCEHLNPNWFYINDFQDDFHLIFR